MKCSRPVKYKTTWFNKKHGFPEKISLSPGISLIRGTMKQIHPLRSLKTSISLPSVSYRRLQAARKIFARHRIRYSEQEMYRRLFKFFLKNWRGRGLKTNGLRRYNVEGKEYEIRPLYINQVLYAAIWQRALHSGESVSRMLDLAIRVYLPRLLESLLGQADFSSRVNAKSAYWSVRSNRRKLQYGDFFINYTCRTKKNAIGHLDYAQKTEIIYKEHLSVMEIWNLMLTAA